MIKRLFQLLLLVIVFGLGFWFAQRYSLTRNRPVESADILLEKIQTVAKLITVEGQFSEIYNYSEYQGYFTLLWDKKALVRVRATVSAGFDLDKLSIQADSASKTLRIGPIPEPEILSIDHNLDYYNLSNGLFTTFAPEDYNRINQRAKDLIRDQAEKSILLNSAREQGLKMIDLMRYMAESAGWTVEIIGQNTSEQTRF